MHYDENLLNLLLSQYKFFRLSLGSLSSSWQEDEYDLKEIARLWWWFKWLAFLGMLILRRDYTLLGVKIIETLLIGIFFFIKYCFIKIGNFIRNIKYEGLIKKFKYYNTRIRNFFGKRMDYVKKFFKNCKNIVYRKNIYNHSVVWKKKNPKSKSIRIFTPDRLRMEKKFDYWKKVKFYNDGFIYDKTSTNINRQFEIDYLLYKITHRRLLNKDYYDFGFLINKYLYNKYKYIYRNYNTVRIPPLYNALFLNKNFFYFDYNYIDYIYYLKKNKINRILDDNSIR